MMSHGGNHKLPLFLAKDIAFWSIVSFVKFGLVLHRTGLKSRPKTAGERETDVLQTTLNYYIYRQPVWALEVK